MSLVLGKVIKERRVQMGFSDLDVAKQIGLSIDWYYDIEAYEDEVSTNVDLAVLRKLCVVLDLNFLGVVTLFCNSEFYHTTAEKYFLMSGHKLIAARCHELALTIPDLADLIGFEEKFVERFEHSDIAIDELNLDGLKSLANALRVPAWLIAS